MTHLHMNAVRQHLRRLAHRQHEEELSDAQLLERFARLRDESAFAALLRRHGPMVLGVCRGILRHSHDVEDAFQATFLILAQKAASIRQRDSAGGWLYEVAYHVAVKARTNAVRRQCHERRTADRVEADPLADIAVRELRVALHEELRQLPEKYRTPVVLCYLEGKTHEEAARQLGWPQRRVKDRLQRGREQLRRRLSQRGLAPVAALSTALFAADGVSAAVPPALTGATIHTVMNPAPVAPAVAALVNAGLSILSVSKAKVAIMILLAVSLLGGVAACGLALSCKQPAEPPVAQASDQPKAIAPKREVAKTVEIHGRVFGPDGKPKVGAKLVLLGEEGKTLTLGVSAVDGRFTVSIPKDPKDKHLVAQSEDTGIDFLHLESMKPGKPVELRLVKDQAIRGRIVNTEGKPVAGVRVAADNIEVYLNNSLDYFLTAWMKLFTASGSGLGTLKQLWPGAGALFAATTDADGRFALHGIGAERTVRLRLSRAGIADTSVWVVNRAGFDPKPYNPADLYRNPKGEKPINWRWWMLSGPDVAVVAEAEKVIRGVVTDADTGKGRPGLEVLLTRYSDDSVHFTTKAKTDAEGRYEIHGGRKAKSYLIVVANDVATATMTSEVWADDTAGYQPVTANLKVKKGVIVTGKVIDRVTGAAVPGTVMAVVLRGNPFVKDYPPFSGLGMRQFESSSDTDADGIFRLVIIPGPVLLMGKTRGMSRIVYKGGGPDPKYPQYFENGGYLGRTYWAFLQGRVNKVLEIEPGVAVVKQDIVLERANVLAEVKIQDAEGRPLAGAWAAANGPKNWIPYGQLESDSTSVYGEATGKPQMLVFYEPKRKLAGTRTLKGDEKQPVVVKLGPAGAIAGRLLDADGKPLAGIAVDLRYRAGAAEEIHKRIHEAKQIVTDAAGAFTLGDVIPEVKFELSFRRDRRKFEREAKPAERAMQVKPGECRDVGALKLKLVPEKTGE